MVGTQGVALGYMGIALSARRLMVAPIALTLRCACLALRFQRAVVVAVFAMRWVVLVVILWRGGRAACRAALWRAWLSPHRLAPSELASVGLDNGLPLRGK